MMRGEHDGSDSIAYRTNHDTCLYMLLLAIVRGSLIPKRAMHLTRFACTWRGCDLTRMRGTSCVRYEYLLSAARVDQYLL